MQIGTGAPEKAPDTVAFDRRELGVILGLYGRMVAAGEWRDYGMSFLSDVAVFSIFRRSAEQPIYRIEKRPKLQARQGQYSVIGMDGRILKRGQDLRTVLRVLDELIAAVDPETLEGLLEREGDLAAFRTLQKQPGWRDRPFGEQMHRWMRSISGRTNTYADRILRTAEPDRLPAPLVAAIEQA